VRLTTGGAKDRVLAIDGGASKTDVWLVAADGSLVSTARGAGSNHQFSGMDGAIDALGTTIGDALCAAGLDPNGRPVAGIGVYCLAGVDLPVDEQRLSKAIAARGWSTVDVLRNDTMAVLRAGARSGWGVAIVCGSGLNCVGLGPDGSIERFPSLAELSGDFAPGGSWLGVRALGLALRSRDGRGPPTALAELVPARFDLPDPEAVLSAVYTGDLDYGRLFELAEVCLGAAASGDRPAAEAANMLADEVTAMATAVIARLGVGDEDVEVVLGGGIFDGGYAGFTERVMHGVSAKAQHAAFRHLDGPPVLGAALLGLDARGGPVGSAAHLRDEARRRAAVDATTPSS
jgi:N-acetylglucosamine kinase-like BadF-type ATPase